MNEQLFHKVLESMWHGTVDVVLLVDDDGKIVESNGRARDVLGWEPAELIGQRVEALVPNGRRGAHREYRRRFSDDPAPRRMGGDVVLFALDARGEELPVDISLNTIEYESRQYTLVVIRDASTRYAYEQQLRRLGFHDALTGLYNRHYFNEELTRVEKGRQWPITLMMADIDGLKEVNDTHGHARGDELIRAAAETISSCVRSDDVVARLGGDEFAVILAGMGREEAQGVSERIEDASGRDDSGALTVRISTGISVAEKGDNLHAALRSADARMYENKTQRKAVKSDGSS